MIIYQWFGPRFFVEIKYRIPQVDLKLMIVNFQAYERKSCMSCDLAESWKHLEQEDVETTSPPKLTWNLNWVLQRLLSFQERLQ